MVSIFIVTTPILIALTGWCTQGHPLASSQAVDQNRTPITTRTPSEA
ncbi:hypothetical protein [Actinomadura napierensis]